MGKTECGDEDEEEATLVGRWSIGKVAHMRGTLADMRRLHAAEVFS
jgi:hypothetical protein